MSPSKQIKIICSTLGGIQYQSKRQLNAGHYSEKIWICVFLFGISFFIGFVRVYVLLGLFFLYVGGVYLFLGSICYSVVYYILGCLFGGVRDILNARAIYFTNRGSVGLTSVDRRTSLLSHLQYPVP